MVFGVDKFGNQRENGFANLSGNGSVGVGEESVFDELLGNGRTALESFTGESIEGGSGNADKIQTVVFEKVLVFDADSGLFDVKRQVANFDRVSIFVSIDIVKEPAVSIQNLGTNGSGIFDEVIRIGNVFEEKTEVEN